MSLSGRELLQHILDEAAYLSEHSRGVTSEEFLRDHTLRRAFVRSLEIIGEAAKRTPEESRLALPAWYCEAWPAWATGTEPC